MQQGGALSLCMMCILCGEGGVCHGARRGFAGARTRRDTQQRARLKHAIRRRQASSAACPPHLLHIVGWHCGHSRRGRCSGRRWSGRCGLLLVAEQGGQHLQRLRLLLHLLLCARQQECAQAGTRIRGPNTRRRDGAVQATPLQLTPGLQQPWCLACSPATTSDCICCCTHAGSSSGLRSSDSVCAKKQTRRLQPVPSVHIWSTRAGGWGSGRRVRRTHKEL